MKNEVRSLLVELAGLPPDFDETANLYLDLGVPSVKAMQLLMDLEEKFGIAIPDDDFIEAASLNDLTALVERLQAAN